MADDGTMGELFRDWDKMKAERKAKRHDHNVEVLLSEAEIPAREQSKNVWRVDTPAGAVMYYPATNCWQHKGKTMRGDVHAFVAWFRSYSFARPQ